MKSVLLIMSLLISYRNAYSSKLQEKRLAQELQGTWQNISCEKRTDFGWEIQSQYFVKHGYGLFENSVSFREAVLRSMNGDPFVPDFPLTQIFFDETENILSISHLRERSFNKIGSIDENPTTHTDIRCHDTAWSRTCDEVNVTFKARTKINAILATQVEKYFRSKKRITRKFNLALIDPSLIRVEAFILGIKEGHVRCTLKRFP